MSKHGTAPKRVVPGWYVEFQQAALRALPRDIDEETADFWRNNGGALAKVFRETLILPTIELIEPADTIIRANRSVRPVYPDWADKNWINEVDFMQLELTGPAEYDISVVELWLHDKQKCGLIKGEAIYEHLRKTGDIKNHFGLVDLLAIQVKGIDFFQKHFAGKAVFGWKSVVLERYSFLRVPYLITSGGIVILRWTWLVNDWNSGHPALRFENKS
ncbi:MAG: hypothetical protein V1867_03620 [Candidatus Falkowbacteria bacterium]